MHFKKSIDQFIENGNNFRRICNENDKNGKHETMKIKYSKYKRMRLNMLKISKQKNMGRISRTMNKTL